MGRTQHTQCLACGTPMPMVMQTTGMYEGTCPHCGVGACIVMDAVPPPWFMRGTVYHKCLFTVPANGPIQETPHLAARSAPRQGAA